MRTNLALRLARCGDALAEAEEEAASRAERHATPGASVVHSSPKADPRILQLALAEHNLQRAESELQHAVHRSEQPVRGLAGDEAAAFKHCAVRLLCSVAGARLEVSLRAALSEWRAAVWLLAALRAPRHHHRPSRGPSPPRALHTVLAHLRAARLARALCQWSRFVAAAAVAAVALERLSDAQEWADEANAGRRLAVQQTKWTVVEMQQLHQQARRRAMRRLVLNTWQHRDLTHAFATWLRHEAAPRVPTVPRHVQEGKWALQMLHRERVAAISQRRGWAMSRLVSTIAGAMLGQVGAAFRVWAYSAVA